MNNASPAVVQTCKTIAAWVRRYPEPQYYDLLATVDAAMREEQAALRTENQRLREALKPFVRPSIETSAKGCWMFSVSAEEIDAVREALAQEQPR